MGAQSGKQARGLLLNFSREGPARLVVLVLRHNRGSPEVHDNVQALDAVAVVVLDLETKPQALEGRHHLAFVC